MARRMRISAAAVALMAVSVDASAFTWQQRRNAWYPPTETLVARDVMAELGWNNLEPTPTPTPAPVPREAIPDIIKRDTRSNTCGYVSGISESSLYCDVDSMCVYNSGQSVVGCCPDTSTNCNLVTTCVDAADGSSILSRGSTIGTETIWCDYASYPSCITHLYGDSGFDGYSLFGCGFLGGTDTIFYTADSDASTSGRGSTSTDFDNNIGTTTATAAGSGTTGSSSGGSSSGGKKKKSNTGAIVGGVVGGVAALAVLAIAGFFMAKKKKQGAEENKMATPPMANIPPAAAPVTTFPPQSPMPGQPPMGVNNMGAPAAMYPPPGPGSPPLQQQGAHIPSMYSVGPVSPGTDYTSSGYPSGTSSTNPMMSPPMPPPSVSPQPQQMYAQPPYGQPSPPPPQQGYGAAWAPQPQQPPPPQQQQQQQGFVAELSTEKGHGEVRELPG